MNPMTQGPSPMTTGGYTSAGLASQAAEIELTRFTIADAIALGQLATERAAASRLGIVIEIDQLGRLVYRAAMPGSSSESDHWIIRKRRVVERFGTSTLAARVKHEEAGTTFADATGLSELEYAAHGGGFPIAVPAVGVVGAMYVSGLPQVDDHEFIVASLRELKSGD
jgi:uncharacterized protein (UPF0303 family)